MKTNSILTYATNLTTLIKDSPTAWIVLSSGVTTGLAKAKTISAEWFIPSLSLMILSILYLTRRKIWRQIQNALDALSRSTAIVHPSHFETIYSKVTIVISNNGKSATFKQTRTVKCNKRGIRHYHYRFYPECKYRSFKSNIGVVTFNDHNEGGVDVIVEFDNPIPLNTILILELSCLMDEVFPSKKEFWCLKKYYIGQEAYELQIRFPKTRYPKTRYAEAVDNGSEGKRRLLENLQLTVIEGKPSLLLKEDSLKDNEDLYVRFTW